MGRKVRKVWYDGRCLNFDGRISVCSGRGVVGSYESGRYVVEGLGEEVVKFCRDLLAGGSVVSVYWDGDRISYRYSNGLVVGVGDRFISFDIYLVSIVFSRVGVRVEFRDGVVFEECGDFAELVFGGKVLRDGVGRFVRGSDGVRLYVNDVYVMKFEVGGCEVRTDTYIYADFKVVNCDEFMRWVLEVYGSGVGRVEEGLISVGCFEFRFVEGLSGFELMDISYRSGGVEVRIYEDSLWVVVRDGVYWRGNGRCSDYVFKVISDDKRKDRLLKSIMF